MSEDRIAALEKEMHKAAKDLQFEKVYLNAYGKTD